MNLHIFYEQSEIKYVGKTLTQPHFCKTMTNIVIKLNKGKYSYADTRANSPTLFGSVSADSLKAKVGLGGDFYNRSAH